MLKKLFANTVAKKTTILAAAFALTCAMIGGLLRSYDPIPVDSGQVDVGQATVLSLSPEETVPPTQPSEVEPVGAASQASLVDLDLDLATKENDYPLSGEYPSLTERPVFTKELADLVAAKSPAIDLLLPVAEGFVYSNRIPLSYDLQKYTYQRCVSMELEYELILALMWRESGFKLDAVGYNKNGTKDNGVMQINDVNKGWLAEKHGITNLMDPYQNIDAGTIILGDFTQKYGAHGALMAYQYGEAGMKRKYAQGVYTNELITKLMNKRDDFRVILQNA